jgi:hypothetical protein
VSSSLSNSTYAWEKGEGGSSEGRSMTPHLVIASCQSLFGAPTQVKSKRASRQTPDCSKSINERFGFGATTAMAKASRSPSTPLFVVEGSCQRPPKASTPHFVNRDSANLVWPPEW